MPISPDKFQRLVLVYDRDGEVCQRVTAVEAAGWCTGGQARRISRDRIKLTGWMEFHPCRTKTGRSYTYRQVLPPAVDLQKRGPQWESGTSSSSGHYAIAHKTIDSGDRGYFIQAVTDNIVFK